MPSQQLHVGDEVWGGVDAQVDSGIVGQWTAAATAPLVEQRCVERCRVEVAAGSNPGAPTGATMHEDCGDAGGIADGFPVDALAVSHVECAGTPRFDRVVHARILARAR